MDRGMRRGPMMDDGYRGGPPPGRMYGGGAPYGGGYGGARGPMMLNMGFPAPLAEPEFVIDREKTCPLLLRVFIKNGSHHKMEEFAVRGKEPVGEIQIYTWMDASFRELSDLIKEVNPQARQRTCRLSFAFIYPDRNGRNVMRQVGQVHSFRESEDDHHTLRSTRFQTGDFLDVAILGGGI